MIKSTPEALKTIGKVSKELGLSTHVLRFWENKFSEIKPLKIKGRRYYKPSDVEIIKKIKELLYNYGYTIKGVQKLSLTSKKQPLSGVGKEELNNSSPRTNTLSVEEQEKLTTIYKNLCKLRDNINNSLEQFSQI